MPARRIRSSSTTSSSGVRNGARLYAVDPRRTSSAEWADGWLGLDVGSDIALANAIGARDHRRRPREPRVHRARDRSTSRPTGPRSRATRSSTPSARPASRPRRSASWRTPSRRRRQAMICWTLGITEHHNAVDNVLALINLVLLTGHVGRYGSGVNPLRGQNNVQGGGDMGALPDRLPGFQHVENDALRAKFDALWGVDHPAEARLAPVGDVRRDGARRADRRLLHRREPGPVGGGPEARDRACSRASTSSSSRTCS